MPSSLTESHQVRHALGPDMGKTPIVEMCNVGIDFRLGGMFSRRVNLRALSNVSLELYKGRALALVGESGSGKSTCARVISRVYKPSTGHVVFRGENIEQLQGAALKSYRRNVQMIFQDPFGSLNPTRTIGYHIERPLRLHNKALSKAQITARVIALLEQVGLSPGTDYLRRRPHELSGGQRQRVAIARALSIEPAVLLADEPTSMLDVSVRLGILNLLEDMKRERELATLYITHDIATARYFAEDTAVLYAGHLVEKAPSETITDNPQHPYTQLLISAVPNPANKISLSGKRRATDIPLWTSDKRGCPFVSRCPRVTEVCKQTMPESTIISENHVVSCHNI